MVPMQIRKELLSVPLTRRSGGGACGKIVAADSLRTWRFEAADWRFEIGMKTGSENWLGGRLE
jgi:hypothetical protein